MERADHTYGDPRIEGGLLLRADRPRLVLDRWRALALVTLAYGCAAWGGWLLFSFVEATRNTGDLRYEQVSMLFAGLMGICWLISVGFLVLRRR